MSRKLPRILAIDDDSTWLEQVPLILEDRADVSVASSIDQGIQFIRDEFFDLVLLDLNFQKDARSGLEIFKMIKAFDRGLDVIIVSGETNPLRLIEVFNFGVTRFIPKPSSTEQIRQEVDRALSERQKRLDLLQIEKGNGAALNPFIGSSSAMRTLREKVLDLVEGPISDLLIQGETGTGKEVLAKYIAHRMDPSMRMIPLHCGAISDGIAESELFGHVKGAFTGAERDRMGIFEAAAGGFVFLDEIGEMPLIQQIKILRVLQERKVQRVGSIEERAVNFRCISATHVDLETAVRSKEFREDLFYRISKSILRLPALRDRLDDIPDLLKSFKLTDRNGRPLEFSAGAAEVLKLSDWPGNIRQLRAVAERIAFKANQIVREADVYEAMPDLVGATRVGLKRGPLGSYGFTLLNVEKKKFEDALSSANGNRNEAARILGISRATYFRRARELGMLSVKRM